LAVTGVDSDRVGLTDMMGGVGLDVVDVCAGGRRG
jgi:hypothetical protein